MKKEIVLPPHLYDRIKASAGEHGGIGRDSFFTPNGEPQCAHGHAWGTEVRMQNWMEQNKLPRGGNVEPELKKYLGWVANDDALCDAGVGRGERVPFALWCELLNVKRGVETPVTESPAEEAEAVIS